MGRRPCCCWGLRPGVWNFGHLVCGKISKRLIQPVRASFEMLYMQYNVNGLCLFTHRFYRAIIPLHTQNAEKIQKTYVLDTLHECRTCFLFMNEIYQRIIELNFLNLQVKLLICYISHVFLFTMYLLFSTPGMTVISVSSKNVLKSLHVCLEQV